MAEPEVIRKVSEDCYMFYCPACDSPHSFNGGWDLHDTLEKPTVFPSLLTTGGEKGIRCHIYIKNGKIEYLPDSSHAFAGQTIDMEEMPEKWL